MQGQYAEAGLLGKALKYLLNQRESLSRFLEHGGLPLDNNAYERSIRRQSNSYGVNSYSMLMLR